MSNPCIASTCLNGNCPGCKGSQPFCNDPRCFPNCPGCTTSEPNNSNWILVTIILVLMGFLLVLGFIIGYSWYNDRKKASEPKSLTVNKHVHTVNPVVPVATSPSITVSSPITTSPIVPPISYKGVDLTLDGIPKTSCDQK